MATSQPTLDFSTSTSYLRGKSHLAPLLACSLVMAWGHWIPPQKVPDRKFDSPRSVTEPAAFEALCGLHEGRAKFSYIVTYVTYVAIASARFKLKSTRDEGRGNR